MGFGCDPRRMLVVGTALAVKTFPLGVGKGGQSANGSWLSARWRPDEYAGQRHAHAVDTGLCSEEQRLPVGVTECHVARLLGVMMRPRSVASGAYTQVPPGPVQ